MVHWVKGKDLRQIGSGNIGATNASRVLGNTKWFILIFLLDALKGFNGSFVLPKIIELLNLNTGNIWTYAPLTFGLMALLGHIFPIYLKFKGGKGVSTACGVFLGLAPASIGIAFLVWFLVVLITRYVSLGSLLAGVFLIIALFTFKYTLYWTYPFGTEILSIITVILIFLLHHTNIRRLLNGTERKWGEKKKT